MNTSPNAWVTGTCATPAPGSSAHNGPNAIGFAHQRTATVTLASIHDVTRAGHPLGTNHSARDLAARIGTTILVGNNLHLPFLLNVRLRSARGQRAPPSDPTRRAWGHILLWQANSANAIPEIHRAIQFHQCQIVISSACIVLGMRDWQLTHSHLPSARW